MIEELLVAYHEHFCGRDPDTVLGRLEPERLRARGDFGGGGPARPALGDLWVGARGWAKFLIQSPAVLAAPGPEGRDPSAGPLLGYVSRAWDAAAGKVASRQRLDRLDRGPHDAAPPRGPADLDLGVVRGQLATDDFAQGLWSRVRRGVDHLQPQPRSRGPRALDVERFQQAAEHAAFGRRHVQSEAEVAAQRRDRGQRGRRSWRQGIEELQPALGQQQRADHAVCPPPPSGGVLPGGRILVAAGQ